MAKLKFTKEGSVVKITMINFMTYCHQSIFPGPNFNVTVGPNGSGKSSIVTALSVCLGGNIRSLNRQTDLQSLINNNTGADKAEVEIELYSSEGKNNIVRTVISRERGGGGGRQTWSVNGKAFSHQDLIAFTEKLQIQPENLCQFLPQDVVRDFPQMSHQNIFYNTVKAIGDTSLLETYENLKKIQVEIEGLEEDLEQKERSLENLTRKESKLEAERQILEQRKKVEDKRMIISYAIKWERFRSLRKQVRETRDKERSVAEGLAKIKTDRDQIKEFLKGYEEKKAALKSSIDSAETEYHKVCRKVEEFEIVNHEDELDRLEEQQRDLAQQEQGRIRRKESLQKEIKELKEIIRTNPLDPGLDEKIKEERMNRTKAEAGINRNEQNKSELEFTVKTNQRDVEKLTRNLTKLENVKSCKLQQLQRENRDTYEGVMWLQRNRDKFRAPVHDPIMLCLDVKDSAYAKYVEIHVGRADLEGFVCEDPDDVNLLLKELREKMKLRKINAFHSNPEDPKAFRKPYDKERLLQYEFDSYISDMYSAPPAVNAYLCRQKKLHEVPVFKGENENTDRLKTMFHNYYIQNYKFVTRRSKYSNELSTGMEDIGSRKVIRLTANIDKTALEQCEMELVEKKKILEANQGRLKRVTDTLDIFKEKEVSSSQRINRLVNQKKEVANRQNELNMKERTLESLMEPQCNLEAEKARLEREKAVIVRQLCEDMEKVLELTRLSNQRELEKRRLYLQSQCIESENSENIDRLATLDRELETATAEHKDIQEKWDKHRKLLQEVHNEADKATGVLSEQVKYKPPEEWQNKFNALGSSDEHVLEVRLEECDSELKQMKKIPQETEDKIIENKKRLEECRSEGVRMKCSLENRTEEATRLRRKWMTGVRELVEDINGKFSGMMADLGYSGQVVLHEGKRDIDFSSYGIRILVKFRTDDEFQELSKGSQSGGEKSVTTAVYMMALQELTQVPFRCVDEINQGMDEKNERNVWAMLLEVCAKYQAQYFYMAPKFPYSLPFDDQVSMIICNSGNTKKSSPDEFNVKSFVKNSRRE